MPLIAVIKSMETLFHSLVAGVGKDAKWCFVQYGGIQFNSGPEQLQ